MVLIGYTNQDLLREARGRPVAKPAKVLFPNNARLVVPNAPQSKYITEVIFWQIFLIVYLTEGKNAFIH